MPLAPTLEQRCSGSGTDSLREDRTTRTCLPPHTRSRIDCSTYAEISLSSSGRRSCGELGTRQQAVLLVGRDLPSRGWVACQLQSKGRSGKNFLSTSSNLPRVSEALSCPQAIQISRQMVKAKKAMGTNTRSRQVKSSHRTAESYKKGGLRGWSPRGPFQHPSPPKAAGRSLHQGDRPIWSDV